MEGIKNDYGEDLLIQTSFDEEVDPFKIWVQVKGRESFRVPLSSSFSLSISSDHVYRWASHIDQVIVILWDTSRNCGWYAIPFEQVGLADLASANRPKFALRFSKEDAFDATAARRLVWSARLRNITARYTLAKASEEFTFNYIKHDEGEEAAVQNAKAGVPDSLFVPFTLMKMIGFVVDDEELRIHGDARQRIKDRCWDYHRHAQSGTLEQAEDIVNDCVDIDEAFDRLLYLIFLAYVTDFTGGVSIPVLLMDPCMTFLKPWVTGGISVEEWVLGDPFSFDIPF